MLLKQTAGVECKGILMYKTGPLEEDPSWLLVTSISQFPCPSNCKSFRPLLSHRAALHELRLEIHQPPTFAITSMN